MWLKGGRGVPRRRRELGLALPCLCWEQHGDATKAQSWCKGRLVSLGLGRTCPGQEPNLGGEMLSPAEGSGYGEGDLCIAEHLVLWPLQHRPVLMWQDGDDNLHLPVSAWLGAHSLPR